LCRHESWAVKRAPRIVLVAQHEGLDLYTDGPRLIAAFREVGISAEVAGWGEDRDWSSFDAVVVRGTYDYIDRPQEFFAWARSVEPVTRLANPARLLEWNGDKRYLRDLAAAGVATVPTRWVEPGDPVTEALDGLTSDEFVVKPATSAGSRLAARYRADEAGRAFAHLERLGQLNLVGMVQPYLGLVDDEGESGTFVFRGEVSHAIRKSAALQPGAEPAEDFSVGFNQIVIAQPVTDELAAFARHVLMHLPPELPAPVYARVDVVRDDANQLALIELELIEPFLFLETAEGSAERFAAAISSWIGG